MHAPDRSATDQERLNRQLNEVLQELRIAMPGVQVLFAFLLAVPFAAGFDQVNATERGIYLVALLTAAVSSALLVAPIAYHRVAFEHGEKARIVAFATRCAVAGLVMLAASMTACVLLVCSVLFGMAAAAATAAFVGATFLWLWFGHGVVRRRTRRPRRLDA